MYFKRFRRIAAASLAAMMLLSACGKTEDVEVTDYGETTVSSDGESGAEESSASSGESGGVNEGDSRSLADKLGGKSVEINQPFSIGTRTAGVNVYYNVPDIESLSAYKVKNYAEGEIKEAEIVKNLLGDSAVSLNSDDRKYLNVDLDDSRYIIICCQYISYKNGGNYNIMANSSPTWIEEDSFYIHTYEGQYRGITYQLMISYSKSFNEMNIGFYPKNTGEIVGNTDLDKMDFSYEDGKFYSYTKGKLHDFDINEAMADSPNRSNISADEALTVAKDALSEKVYVDFPDSVLSTKVGTGTTLDSSEEPCAAEVIFYDEDKIAEDSLDGAVRNGYHISVMRDVNGLSFLTNVSLEEDKADEFMTGDAFIDDEGIIGFNLTCFCSFEEEITNNVNIISFEEAMNSFVEGAEKNIDVSKIEDTDSDVVFESIDLQYYPVPIDGSSNEYNLLPVWVMHADNSKRETMVTVLINATDGSYVDVFY